MEWAPFCIPSTSFCSLSWFTTSCAYHLITLTAFALITYHCLPFTPDLKLMSFTNPFLHGHSYSFWTAFTHLESAQHWTKWALTFVSFTFSFFFNIFSGYTCARLSWSHSAFESTLNVSSKMYNCIFTVLVRYFSYNIRTVRVLCTLFQKWILVIYTAAPWYRSVMLYYRYVVR